MDYSKQIDYSSLSTYIGCRRKFLFQYVMNLRSKSPSIDLVFGACWHYGLELAYKHLQAKPESTAAELTELSSQGFSALWDLEGAPHFDPDVVFPKSPVHAMNMYAKYWDQFLASHARKQIVGVEEPFALALKTPNGLQIEYIGRMDLILQEKDFLEIVDHKTTKSVSAITSPSYEVSLQTDGYLTAGTMYYDSIPRITYLTALCQKSKIAFEIYTYTKTKSAIERFLSDICWYTDQINADLHAYVQQDLPHIEDKSYNLQSFKRSPGYSCTQYFRKCAFFDLCTMRNNPIQFAIDPPQGYEIKEWNPAEHDAEIKRKLEGAL